MIADRDAIDSNILELPETLQREGLLVAWSLEHAQPSMPLGFNLGNPDCCPETGFLDAVMFDDRGNILTFSGQRGSTDANCVIPAALGHSGGFVSLSSSPCSYLATAAAREQSGSDVILLDPYGLSGRTSAAFNPLTLLDPERQDLQEKARNLATLVCPLVNAEAQTHAITSRAQQFLAAVLLYQVLQEPPLQRTLDRTRAIIFDSPQQLQGLMKTLAGSPHPPVRQAASFLALTPPELMTAMLSYLQDQLQFLDHQGVVEAVSSTSFDLEAFADGKSHSIYIILPGHQPSAYARLGQLWLGSLLQSLARRVRAPEDATLVVVDQAQDLGSCDTLLHANNHLGAIGVHLWTIWADAEALRSVYPQDWRRFLSEAWVVQAFGTNTMVVAQEIAAVTGFPKPTDIMDLDHDEMILVLSGDMPVIAQRVNGFTDPVFKDRVDRAAATGQGTILAPKKRSQRKFVRQEPSNHLPPLSPHQVSRLLELANPK